MTAVIIGRGSAIDPRALPLHGKDRTFIPNEQWPEDSAEALRQRRAIDIQTNPDAILRRESGTYDCLGLVFASRRTIIDIDVIDIIIKADGLRYLSTSERPVAGDLVLYRNRHRTPTHIGVILDITPRLTARDEITVLSKWGAHAEYVHAINDVTPLLGTPTDYLTERPV